MDKPKQIENIKWKKLIKLCQRQLDFYDSDFFREDREDERIIFQETMKIIFGPNVFDWIYKKQKI